VGYIKAAADLEKQALFCVIFIIEEIKIFGHDINNSLFLRGR
jgi:hypothetical protein